MKILRFKKQAISMATMMFFVLGQQAIGQQMDELWGRGQDKTDLTDPGKEKGKRFREGKYAMFIHWGLYSQLANKWDGKTYYGIGEWMMDENMAGLSTKQYVTIAKDFNPVDFDAKAIVQLAKDAGMKYIIITSKHHDGFAMYDSKVNDFNIVAGTPFKRDPMKELAEACAAGGLGFGFYYSHNQDWTSPYGTTFQQSGTLDTNSFESYFRNKCLPQVEEITSNYGPIELVWFDTPGNMKKEYIEELVAVVRKNQPNAFVSGRAGHGLGDYNTLGDMEIPLRNTSGLWETVDVTNDAWGYAWYDNNWKSPKEVLQRLISTVARGGTYMLNIGLDGRGNTPDQAQRALRSAGKWLKQHEEVIYKAEASPWQHALAWGDVTKKGKKLLLSVYDWPTNGKLYLPGLQTSIRSAKLISGGKDVLLKYQKAGNWTVFSVPNAATDPLVSVIELELTDTPKVDPILAVDPQMRNTFAAEFATVSHAKKSRKGWMEKFGEWKHVTQVSDWKDEAEARWTVDVLVPGYYQTELEYSGEGKLVWRINQSDGMPVQNQQNSSAIYAWHPIGWIYFTKPGKYDLSVSLIEGNREKASLSGLRLQAIQF